MRRACRRSARILARVVLPTRRGPSMTMKWGGCGPLCGTRARRAAEDSLAAIRSVCPGRIGGTHGIIAELFPWQDQGASPAGIHERAAQRSASAMELPKMSNCFLKNGLVRGFPSRETEGLAEGTN